MKTVAEVLELSSQFLRERRVDRSRRIAEDLLAHVLQCKRIDLYLQYDRPLLENELASMRELIKRCASQEPLDYLIGEVEFLGCPMGVDRRALIPRPETEILADLILKKLTSYPSLEGLTLWDVGCGSGCIGISLKKKCPDLAVALSDLSQEALSLSRENAQKNGVEVEINQGDLLVPFKGRKTDFFVSNPPYISAAEYASLDASVKDFEPKMALVGGDRGVEFYERLERELPDFLNHRASVFFEIGAGQGGLLKNIFSSPHWRAQQVLPDWSGKERFFFLEMQ